MIYDLVKSDNPILYKRIPDYSFEYKDFEEKIREKTVNDLRETMEHHNALGLAANQVGIPVRVFVMKDRYAVFNPVVLTGHFPQEDTEACLSFPNVEKRVERPSWIRVWYQNIDGDVVKETLSGLHARIFQHEMDHLNGITIMERGL